MTEMKKVTILFSIIGISLNGFSQELNFQNRDGFFSIGTQPNRTASITLIDIDKDGDLDALVANGRHWAEQNYLFYNDGYGGFKLAQPIGKFLNASYAIKSADFNNDGFMDIAVANDNIDNKIYFGSSVNNFTNGISFGSKSPSRNLEIADIDNDGDIDLILSNRKAKNEICLNDGKGNFKNRIYFGNETDQTIQTKLIDINGDGFLDLVTQFGFAAALIQNQQATKEDYDTVWTLSIIRAILLAVIMCVLSIPLAEYFKEPAVQHLIYVYAISTLIQGFNNVGIVDFLKNMQFHLDFKFNLFILIN